MINFISFKNMYFVGRNKFPCRRICCCISTSASKSMADMRVLMTCGPQSGRVALTFALMNIPLVAFTLLTSNFFYNDVYNLSGNFVWRILIYCQICLIVLTNLFFVLASSTDPGIIPARSWTSCKQDIAGRYK